MSRPNTPTCKTPNRPAYDMALKRRRSLTIWFVKLLGQRRMARDFDCQVVELQVRVTVLNGFTALGIPARSRSAAAVGDRCADENQIVYRVAC